MLDGVDLLEPEPAPDTELHRVHVPSYLEAVRRAPLNGDDPAHGLGTDDNPIFEGMHEASCLVCGGSLLAAREIAAGRADRAVNIAGGLHHAMPNHAAGFCVYNDCAVAISWLLDHGFDRIAYIDVDVHHGDGVQAAFYHDPRASTISLHQHPLTLWPGTGWPAEYGEGAAAGSAVNVVLPPGTADAGWLRAFHAVVPSLLHSFRPQVLVTQGGADTTRKTRWRTWAVRRRPPHDLPGAARARGAHGRRQVARSRRGWVRPVPCGPAVVDASARDGARP